jgi:ATP-dependent HslUV protease ATP-binding subunit HslU
VRLAETSGVVFIDEIDKVCVPAGTTRHSGDASDEGVQRDLLPVVEGSTVTTPHGPVSTRRVLFLCAGAFHHAKPEDLLPELQGRLPLRLTLDRLQPDQLFRVLACGPRAMLAQHSRLFAAEEVQLLIEHQAVLRLAHAAAQLNRSEEDLGARRLHAVVEQVLGDASFDASEWGGEAVFVVTEEMVKQSVQGMFKNKDLAKYCL